MDRQEYVLRARELARRGEALPQTKLSDDQVREIRALAEERARLRREITERLSNRALAERYGVHPRTVEKVLSWERLA